MQPADLCDDATGEGVKLGLEVRVDLLQAVNAFFVDFMHLLELALPLDHLCDLLHKIGVVLLQVPVLLFQRALQLTDVLVSPALSAVTTGTDEYIRELESTLKK